jgi:hypothetical protein
MTAPEDMPPVPPGFKRFMGLGLAVFVIGFFAVLAGPTLMDAWAERQLLKNGSDATATIVALQDTRDVVNEQPVVRLTVDVTVEGREPWRAEIVTPLSPVDLQNYRVGAQVRVRYNPEEPSKVALVGPLLPAPK